MRLRTKVNLALVGVFLPLSAFAYYPQRPAIILTQENLKEIADTIGSITLEVDMTTEKVSWPMTQTEISVLMGKLQDLSNEPNPTDKLFDALPEKDPNYKGISLVLKTRDGDALQSVKIFEGRITTDGQLFHKDGGREIEYWLFGTAKVVKQQLLAIQVLPVFTFDQCRLLGNRIVETQPRQCLLPDNNLLFDVPDKPTIETLSIKTFDDCLEKGEAIIHTFPRRCMASGGRVFTEPPRLLEDEAPQLQLMKPVGGTSSQESENADIEEQLLDHQGKI